MLYRKATMADLPAVHQLVNDYAAQGLMLRRTMTALIESVRDFTVAIDDDGTLVGVGALHIMSGDLAELRCLAVKSGTTKKGVGRGIVDAVVSEAQALGLKRVFALTYQQGFFEKCGFHVVQKESMPVKVWKECVYCDKFHKCDEIAMIRLLVPAEELLPEVGMEIPLVEMPNWVKG